MTQDYTRWNRAGLQRLHYVDGNAPTYLEDMRQLLRTQFASEPDVLRWLGDHDDAESLAEWQQRLMAQYQAPRRDYGWETLRTLSRALHVLARYGDAFANERYIGTATQWDSLRRLVAQLDYRPAPPASAETWIALLADEEEAAIGKVEAGLAVEHEPADGGEPVVFETLANLEVDYRLNRLQAPALDQPVEDWTWSGSVQRYFWATEPKSPKVGDWGLVTANDEARAVTLEAVLDDALDLTLRSSGPTGISWKKSDVRLLRRPQWQQAPKLNGSKVLDFGNAALAVKAGDVLLNQTGSNYDPCRVVAVDGSRVQLNKTVSGGSFHLAQLSKAQTLGGQSRAILPTARGTTQVWNASLSVISASNVRQEFVRNDEGDSTGETLYNYVNVSQVYYLPEGSEPLTATQLASANRLSFTGKPGELASAQWLVLHSPDTVEVHKISAVVEENGYFELLFAALDTSKRWTYARGLFAESLPLDGFDRNTQAIYFNSSTSQSQIELALDSLPAVFKPGRLLWFESDDDAVLATIKEVQPSDDSGLVRFSVTPSLAGRFLPKHNTRVYANVVLAGHGESQDEKVLGSGDRIQANQQFTFSQKQLSFVQDANFSNGVRAAVDVRVDGRVWTQVETLRYSQPTDTHYTLDITETGEAQLHFGDGIHGQRLPTGTDNVRISYRKGRGLAGNLPAHNLNELKKPHALVEAVVQPLASAGGGETEGTESLREQAPQSVLTLGRAVALKDFGRLAQAHSGVWQAAAFALPDRPGLSDRVEVVVVPAGGGELGPLQANLEQLLRQHSPPAVQVKVSRFEPVLIGLEITLQVETDAFDAQSVADAVTETLYQRLALQHSRLGQPLYRSTVIDIVAGVTGVSSAQCRINELFHDEAGTGVTLRSLFIADDGSVRRASPTPRQVLYLDAANRPVNINVQEV